jgi:hypothetical protein
LLPLRRRCARGRTDNGVVASGDQFSTGDRAGSRYIAGAIEAERLGHVAPVARNGPLEAGRVGTGLET